MSKLDRLKQARTLADIAILLGYQPKNLAYILYKIDPDNKYTKFPIPKKTGGVREICAPKKKLKNLQKTLSTTLYECTEEIRHEDERVHTIKGDRPKRKRAEKSPSHGFQQGLSIASNAERHIRKRYVLNLDIENFFPSLNFGRVRGFFIRNKNFNLSPKAATIIAQIACHENQLPQGSPCSPVISNLLGQILDVRLARLAKKNKCTYTRYVDDITISTNMKTFPKAFAYEDRRNSGKWILGEDLVETIISAGYAINLKKTRMQLCISRQMVTGLVINKYVNVRKEYYKNARAMCHALFEKGDFDIKPVWALAKKKQKPKTFLQKVWCCVKSIWPLTRGKEVAIPIANNAGADTQTSPKLEKLGGILGHIYYTKNYRNKFAKKTDEAFFGEKGGMHNAKILAAARHAQYSDISPQKKISGIRKLYAEFLFYKHFYALEAPLIVCEGKTDPIYIKCALERLAERYPSLISMETKNGKTTKVFKVGFFKRTKNIAEIMQLPEGVGGVQQLILNYASFFKKFRAEGKRHPVICLVDNDDEGQKIYALTNEGKCTKTQGNNGQKENCNGKPKFGEKSFYYINENLYVITFPRKGGKPTEIEDLFDEIVLGTTLNGGRTFNRTNHNDPTRYNKIDFANKVVKPNLKSINFDGFIPVLDCILQTILDYQCKVAAAKASSALLGN